MYILDQVGLKFYAVFNMHVVRIKNLLLLLLLLFYANSALVHFCNLCVNIIICFIDTIIWHKFKINVLLVYIIYTSIGNSNKYCINFNKIAYNTFCNTYEGTTNTIIEKHLVKMRTHVVLNSMRVTFLSSRVFH